jgi:hypothetical protein
VSATVEAAIIGGCFGLIGVGGTVWVAVTGFRRRANRRIAGEAASAERSRALWEKRCTAYEEIIQILYQRQTYRSGVLARARTKKLVLQEPVEIMTKLAGDFNDPATLGPRSRLMAYSSPEVRTAYEQMVVDDTAVGARITAWGFSHTTQRLRELAEKTGKPVDVPGPAPEEAWALVEEALALVLRRSKTLIDMIRRELGSDPG